MMQQRVIKEMYAQEREKEREPVLFFISHSLLAGEGPTLCSFIDFLKKKKKVSSKQVWTQINIPLSKGVLSNPISRKKILLNSKIKFPHRKTRKT